MPTSNYPQSSFPQSQDDAYGGIPSDKFGQPARSFIDSCIQALQSTFFKYFALPATVQRVVCSSGCSMGDVCFLDEGQLVSAQSYYARNKNTGTGTAVMWGVFADAASVGDFARLYVGGLVPYTVTGLGGQVANTPVAVDAGTGKLRVAVAGDTVVGYFDVNGNVFLLFPGRLV